MDAQRALDHFFAPLPFMMNRFLFTFILLLFLFALLQACATSPQTQENAALPKSLVKFLLELESASTQMQCEEANLSIAVMDTHLIQKARKDFILVVESPNADETLDLLDSRLALIYENARSLRCERFISTLEEQLEKIGYAWVYTKDIDHLVERLILASSISLCDDALLSIREIPAIDKEKGIYNLRYLRKRGFPIHKAEKLSASIETLYLQAQRCPELLFPLEDILGQ